MTPEDRHYLMKTANLFVLAQRYHKGVPIRNKEVGDYFDQPETDTFIKVSHLSALDLGIKITEIAARDRQEEGLEITTGEEVANVVPQDAV